MMACIQILAFVLCSFFLQDAFSVRYNGVQSNESDDQMMQTIEEVNEAPESSPSPSKKYPNLTAVKDMFWDTIENINRANENGKLEIRALRNTMNNVLRDDVFWSSLVRLMKKYASVTFDSKRADRKIQLYNTFTSIITNPTAVQGFEDITNELYNTVSSIRMDVDSNAVQKVTNMVNSGSMIRDLDAITGIVNKIDWCPKHLIKDFDFIHMTLNMLGSMKMNNNMSKGLISFSSNFK
ncbi:PREDICTED: uncharacterized protein LOC107172580 [Diuraphis noxia]|uniref:uncharacterized protein LOC107172580 n=1 Tax=Diuraphis noxia TaxID=143948 RepID=UPI0007637C90|nr:PREDICTED: uncharacterized protein LOC107172580 [Diuraphis noxia]